ncbi:helix-hairpin-helix domain-containing protein [uncultured Tenacibaculum sp.]|uniref:ComEA family DNA-binding protein n=1 Tax=uncultured Tenacibaculum sp. TaxID=174713 RepID=UPI00261919B7|nr:helix-hairpin-helix domain-containing protein [uncultured Tenacibaculum sp.]
MKIFKSHFWYNKRQRNGIFFLLLIVVILQCGYWYTANSTVNDMIEESEELLAFREEIDSLKLLEIERRKPKIYPFNPNFISDFKGYKLGMSLEEIDRLHAFRKKNQYVNSAKEFQIVTKISDSLLAVIVPYFKFPDWVIKKNKRLQREKKRTASKDIKRLERVVVIEEAKEVEAIKKININTATFKEVLRIPEIDYELCKMIFEYRDEVAELQDISELRNIKDFPLEKYNRIILYLEAK